MKSLIRPLFLLGAAVYLGVTDYWFGHAAPVLIAIGGGMARAGAFLGTAAWLMLTIAFAIWCVINFIKHKARP